MKVIKAHSGKHEWSNIKLFAQGDEADYKLLVQGGEVYYKLAVRRGGACQCAKDLWPPPTASQTIWRKLVRSRRNNCHSDQHIGGRRYVKR
jgi:hypothetical protein